MRIRSWLNCMVVLVLGLTSFVDCKSTCDKPTLENGRVRIRGRGKMVYFRCRKRFERVGARFAICAQNGQWSHEAPICVTRGCPDLGELPNLLVKELYNGGMVKFECQPGMSRKGPEQLTCDGKKWSERPPTCVVGANLFCDFETDTLCGWSQESEDDFDWTWFSGATPTLNTGPKFDHTLGQGKDGHYLFIEASSPRSSGHKASLKSPVFPPDLGESCFQFWYHMMGPDSSGAVGKIEVYSQPDSASLDMLSPLWSLEGNQGDKWHVAVVRIPPQDENFQIIILGTRLDGYVSDLAIDDVILTNCSEITTPKAEETTTPMTTTSPTTPQTPLTTTTVATSTAATTTSKPTKSTRSPETASTTTRKTTTTPQSTTAATTTTTMTTTPATSPSTTTPTTTPMTTTTTMATTITPTTSTPTTPTTTTSSTTALTTTESTTVTEPSKAMTTPSTVTTTPSTGESSPTPTTPSSSMSSDDWLSLRTDKVTDGMEAATTTPQVDTSSVSDSPEVTPDQGSGEVPVVTDGSDNTDVVTPDYNEIPDFPPTINKTSNDTSNEIPNFSSGTAKQKAYLPMIIGLSAGIAAGLVIIAVLAVLWTRNQRKKKQQAEEDEISMINSLEGNLFNHN